MNVEDALKKRISIRNYLSKPVDEETLRTLFERARWSPSGGNMQPWKVIVVTGQAREEVVKIGMDEAIAAYANPDLRQDDEFNVYPPNLTPIYNNRRKQVGQDMYEVLGIPREDKISRYAHVGRNYEFFGAPVGVFFIIDRQMGRGQWAHLGMFMQSVCLAATEMGLGTCIQEAWAFSRKSLAKHFELPDNEILYCGMSLGWPDMVAPLSKFRSKREVVDSFVQFKGF
ncbi:nitroreductase [Hirschia litorea]|uniref:Nitroreductase n=1 Tax=Hirschia litorea TaxID=1199156 RepID=A0ABW2IPZ8_9PROT